MENTRLPRDRVETIVVRPTTDDSDANLPNGKEWYSPLRITILKLLPHGAAIWFARIQAKNVDSKKEEAESVLKIITQKMTTYTQPQEVHLEWEQVLSLVLLVVAHLEHF